MTTDHLFPGLNHYLKLTLELASLFFAVGPLLVFLRVRNLPIMLMFIPIFVFLFGFTVVLLRIIEKEMYEVLRNKLLKALIARS